VDRKALPEPERGSERAYEAPQGEIEVALAAAWADVLEVAKVGRHDDFFELGGHSLSVLSVQTRMHRQFSSMQVPLKVYFEHPTLAALAEALQAVSRTVEKEEATDLAQMAALLAELED
jgi:hypothetical protein